MVPAQRGDLVRAVFEGVGEAPIVPPLPAVACALSRLVGHRLTELPLSPPVLLQALDQPGAAG